MSERLESGDVEAGVAHCGRAGRRTTADRQEAVLAVVSGKAGLGEVARRHGVSPGKVSRWRDDAVTAIAQVTEGGGAEAALEREIAELRASVRALSVERSLLLGAVAAWRRGSNPYSVNMVATLDLRTECGKATVRQVCRLFGISRSAYYAAKSERRPRRPGVAVGPTGTTGSSSGDRTTAASARVSDGELRAAIDAIVVERPAWGSRKVWATLRRPPFEMRAGIRRVWATMKGRGVDLADSAPLRREAPRGRVVAEAPNRRWGTDLTTVWTALDGLVAVVPVVDCGCRTVLELGVTKRQDAASVLARVRRALDAQFGTRDHVPEGLELRTDHGSQYTSAHCEAMCQAWGLNHTLAPVGRPTGNAVAERVIKTMKEECIWLNDWQSAAELAAALEDWRTSYNEQRPHQALDWQTPSEVRRAHGRKPPPA